MAATQRRRDEIVLATKVYQPMGFGSQRSAPVRVPPELDLEGPFGQVVEALLGGEPEEVPGVGGGLGQGEVPGGEVAAAHVGHLALTDQLLHRLPDLASPCRSVDVMHLVGHRSYGNRPIAASRPAGRMHHISPTR